MKTIPEGRFYDTTQVYQVATRAFQETSRTFAKVFIDCFTLSPLTESAKRSSNCRYTMVPPRVPQKQTQVSFALPHLKIRRLGGFLKMN